MSAPPTTAPPSAAVHGAERLCPGLRLARRPSAPLLNAGRHELRRSLLLGLLPVAMVGAIRDGVVARSRGVGGGGGPEGVAVLGRRGAPACSGAGDHGRTASETMPRGWTVFEIPSTPRSLLSVR
jgi:hypothetical protein